MLKCRKRFSLALIIVSFLIIIYVQHVKISTLEHSNLVETWYSETLYLNLAKMRELYYDCMLTTYE